MCFIKTPKIKAPPPPAQMQAMQAPKDFTNPERRNKDKMRRRGMYAAIFTSPLGLQTLPNVTGSGGGATGG